MPGDAPQRRVQELRPCEDAMGGSLPCEFGYYEERCDGCAGDGSRWVTVGTLRQPSDVDGDCEWVPVWIGNGTNQCFMQHPGEPGAPLYVIEEQP